MSEDEPVVSVSEILEKAYRLVLAECGGDEIVARAEFNRMVWWAAGRKEPRGDVGQRTGSADQGSGTD